MLLTHSEAFSKFHPSVDTIPIDKSMFAKHSTIFLSTLGWRYSVEDSIMMGDIWTPTVLPMTLGEEANICGVSALPYQRGSESTFVCSESDIHWCTVITACARPSEICTQEILNLNILPGVMILRHPSMQFSKVSKHSDHIYIESQKRRYNNHQVSMCCIRNKDVLLDIIANEATDKGLISII